MKFKSSFQKTMWLGSFISLGCMVLFFGGNAVWKSGLLYSLGITALTIFYHLAVRLFIGEFVVVKLGADNIDYHQKWFQQTEWEKKLYQALKVKKWKTNMPTYSPEEFDIKKHSIEEIVQATCRSELVHELDFVASFLPLLFTLCFGSFFVFLFTSLAAACFDLIFVIMQRFNRPRLVRMIRKGSIGKKAESKEGE